MDHDLAIKNNTAERYLLGELTEVEMEAYEEHFFSCTACAQEVKLGSQFIEDAREVFKTDFQAELKPVVHPSTAWGRLWNSMRHPAPAFAFASLVVAVCFNFYQNSLVQDLRKPEVFTATSLKLHASRRGVVGDEKIQVGSHQPIRITFDIPKGNFSSYVVEVWNEAGARQASIPVSADQAKNTVQVKFHSGSFKQGNYALVIQGVTSGSAESAAKSEVARYPFSVNIQD
jgi:hypothetical protein